MPETASRNALEAAIHRAFVATLRAANVANQSSVTESTALDLEQITHELYRLLERSTRRR